MDNVVVICVVVNSNIYLIKIQLLLRAFHFRVAGIRSCCLPVFAQSSCSSGNPDKFLSSTYRLFAVLGLQSFLHRQFSSDKAGKEILSFVFCRLAISLVSRIFIVILNCYPVISFNLQSKWTISLCTECWMLTLLMDTIFIQLRHTCLTPCFSTFICSHRALLDSRCSTYWWTV